MGAAMSMPECGLRDSPLNMRRKPKELERRPGTGWASRSVGGASGENASSTARILAVSRETRASSSAERFTCEGGTLSCCVAYCFGTISNSTAVASAFDGEYSILVFPGSASSGMPTIAIHRPARCATMTGLPLNVADGRSSLAEGSSATYTPPGTAATRGAMNVSAPDAGAEQRTATSASRARWSVIAILDFTDDLRTQPAACQPRFDLGSRGRLRGVAQQCAVGHAANYREATAQRGERTHGIERARGECQALFECIHAPGERSHQPLAQRRGLRAQGLEPMTRILAPQPRTQDFEALLFRADASA